GPPRRVAFPPRRSSDLADGDRGGPGAAGAGAQRGGGGGGEPGAAGAHAGVVPGAGEGRRVPGVPRPVRGQGVLVPHAGGGGGVRSEEHTSELQSRENLV